MKSGEGLLRHWAVKEKNSEKLRQTGRLELDEENRDGLSSSRFSAPKIQKTILANKIRVQREK